MASECCQCYGPPVPEHIGNRKLDMSPNMAEFVSFLVVLPLALYSVFWHHSHMKPVFVVLASLLFCQFFLFFEPSEMKEMFIELAGLILIGLAKSKDFLEQMKDKLIELHYKHVHIF